MITVSKDGVEMGRALLYTFTNPNRGKKYGLLADVMIEPEYRGGGLGTELVQKVIDTAKGQGCYKILADSRFSREKVHAWYEKLGFSKHGYGFRMNFEEVPEQK